MPSLDIHITLAREYLKKYNDIKDRILFIKGNLDPDLLEDRNASHYTIKTDDNSLYSILKNKIGLFDYLNNKTIDSDYEKGYFFHLITDYEFFNNFFDKEYIKNTKYSEFKKDLYYSYNLVHDYLINNYDVDYSTFEEEVTNRIKNSQLDANYLGEVRKNIITYKKLDDFINELLKNNINDHIKYYRKIMR